jgi:hypothetical protein
MDANGPALQRGHHKLAIIEAEAAIARATRSYPFSQRPTTGATSKGKCPRCEPQGFRLGPVGHIRGIISMTSNTIPAVKPRVRERVREKVNQIYKGMASRRTLGNTCRIESGMHPRAELNRKAPTAGAGTSRRRCGSLLVALDKSGRS